MIKEQKWHRTRDLSGKLGLRNGVRRPILELHWSERNWRSKKLNVFLSVMIHHRWVTTMSHTTMSHTFCNRVVKGNSISCLCMPHHPIYFVPFCHVTVSLLYSGRHDSTSESMTHESYRWVIPFMLSVGRSGRATNCRLLCRLIIYIWFKTTKFNK